jgi:ketosteroid isomerase-like protein
MQFDSRLGTQDISNWTSFIAQLDAAQEEFARGRPDAFKALWSHADDATLIGGLGGAVEVGYGKVAARLDWASTNYAETKRSNETYTGAVGPELAYLVRREVIDGEIAGRTEKQELRVTMVFRRENGAWRILHRHADSQTVART